MNGYIFKLTYFTTRHQLQLSKDRGHLALDPGRNDNTRKCVLEVSVAYLANLLEFLSF